MLDNLYISGGVSWGEHFTRGSKKQTDNAVAQVCTSSYISGLVAVFGINQSAHSCHH